MASLAAKSVHASPVAELLDTSSEDHAKREAYAGYYSAFLQSPSEPTKLLKSLVHLSISGDRLVSRWDESFTRTKDGSFQASRYEGVVHFLGDHIFIVEVETSTRETVLETILRVPYRRRAKLLTGITMGMTTGHQRMPFASIAAFKTLGKRIDGAAQHKQCGFYDLNSRNVGPIVKDVFSSQGASHLYPKSLERI